MCSCGQPLQYKFILNLDNLTIYLPILKGDVPRCRAEIIQISSEGLSLPVDDQSSSCTSKSHY